MDSFDAPPTRDAMTEYAMPQIHPVAVTIPPESESSVILGNYSIERMLPNNQTFWLAFVVSVFPLRSLLEIWCRSRSPIGQ